jgi:beta-glucosidase
MAGRTYRYAQRNVLFPFGYGQAYSVFKYSALSVAPAKAKPCENVTVTVTVTNDGSMACEEVVQVYLTWEPPSTTTATLDVSAAPTPAPTQQLVAFRRVLIAAQQAVTLTLVVHPKQLSLLTEPRCGQMVNAVQYEGIAITSADAPLAAAAKTPADCCKQCTVLEQCEAFTFDGANEICSLLSARTRAGVARAGFVSGDTLPVWVQQAGTATLAVGGQQPVLADGSGARLSSNVLSATVTITGQEVAISRCE